MTSDFMDTEIDYQKTGTSQEVMIEFIDIYRENPCLWKLSHPDHKKPHVKHTALLKLLDCIRKEEPKADLTRVKLKINNIRTSFKREVRKAELSRKSKGEAQVYCPKLWYYGMLWFILEAEKENDQILGRLRAPQDRAGGETQNRGDESIPSPCRDGSFRVKNYEVATSESSKSDLSNTSPPSRRYSPPSNKLTQTHRINIENSDKASRGKLTRKNFLKSSVKKHDYDEFDFVGRVVATKLRKLPNRMKIIAEKLIHDVLYQAQLDHITVDSNVVTLDAHTE